MKMYLKVRHLGNTRGYKLTRYINKGFRKN